MYTVQYSISLRWSMYSDQLKADFEDCVVCERTSRMKAVALNTFGYSNVGAKLFSSRRYTRIVVVLVRDGAPRSLASTSTLYRPASYVFSDSPTLTAPGRSERDRKSKFKDFQICV